MLRKVNGGKSLQEIIFNQLNICMDKKTGLKS